MATPLEIIAKPAQRLATALRDFLRTEAAGGLILMGTAVLALVVANSPLAPAYFSTLKSYILGLSVQHWVNDALMALFFLLVGLEIKREMTDGQLRQWSDRVLPGIAAFGGMVVPALIYAGFNLASPGTLRGWAIPSATDIAFALGVLSLLGPRVPVSLKVFLTALAILDDLGAVLIIAIFYTADLSVPMLGASALTLAALVALNLSGVQRLWPYLLLGAVLWYVVLQSGVHATLAGVALALTIPIRRTPGTPEAQDSPLIRLEHGLAKWVAFGVVPIFGFANAGVSFAGMSFASLLAPVPLGIMLGLFLGKQVGVFGCVWAAVRLGWASLPARAGWMQLYGVSLLCGIGFTMSLFIGLLAFSGSEALQDEVKIGVLAGSVLSAVVGAAVMCLPRRKPA
ncbi:sodium/proton antiporter (NhaA family) [Humitalea rosea]|uniref:Na(+)/H(+) antiporter NhaA n=1 Tax=Humitalea rosea TaxID=990373 RepID=A0A2W7ISV1_9PROT|nr:Na+/H+ antiporter NhaA [Humitalea rosea]PZW50329.1 sodium/proton antiporter (NhaA family) [Humitalea rosea]